MLWPALEHFLWKAGGKACPKIGQSVHVARDRPTIQQPPRQRIAEMVAVFGQDVVRVRLEVRSQVRQRRVQGGRAPLEHAQFDRLTESRTGARLMPPLAGLPSASQQFFWGWPARPSLEPWELSEKRAARGRSSPRGLNADGIPGTHRVASTSIMARKLRVSSKSLRLGKGGYVFPL